MHRPWKLEGHERLQLGKMHHPVRGILHGTAAVLSIVGAVLLTVLPVESSAGQRVSLLAFGLSLVALYSVSALYHSVPWRWDWKVRMQRLDHSMIFVLIAASYTPIGVLVLDGPQCAHGYTWWLVSGLDGLKGWAAEASRGVAGAPARSATVSIQISS